MTAASTCIQRSLDSNSLREPVFRSVIRTLGLPPGSRGLDAGSGPGLQASLLAEALEPGGHVTGIDIDPEVVAYGEDRIRRLGLGDRITLYKGDVSSLPFEDGSFDWAWSADCIGYPLGELKPILMELLRVLKPGGGVFLLGWTSQQILPGYPLLEARLNATCSGYLPFIEGKKPEMNFLRAMRWMREAGLEQVRANTFVGEVQAPLSEGERAALLSLFEMLWIPPETGVMHPQTALSEDWAVYQRLCNPESQEFILDLPDYYAFFTYTLFQGKVAKGEIQ